MEGKGREGNGEGGGVKRLLYASSLVLGNELSVELLDALDDSIYLVLRRQESDTEVISAFTLAETRARHNANASSFQKLESVEGVRRHFSGFSSLDDLRWQNDTWEEVHSTRWLGASEAFERIDGSTQLEGTTLERLNDIVPLLLVELVRSVSGFGWINHTVHHDLTHGVRAESNGSHLVQLGLDFRKEVVELDVTTTVTAFAKETLGDRMEAGNLNALENIITHVVSDLTEADKLSAILINVLLVHFISKEHNAALDAETDDLLHALNRKDVASWVVGVDDNKSTALDALSSSLLISAVELSWNESPASLFVQRITDLDTVLEGEQGSVERILGSRSHDTDLLVRADHEGKHVADSSRSTISDVDGVRVTRKTITSSDEVSNILTDDMMALAERVCASQEASIKQALCTSNCVRSESLRSLLDELRVFHERQHLSDESQRLLLKLLRVTDVAVGHVFEWKTRRNALLLSVQELHLKVVSASCYSATNLILCNENTGVNCITTENMNVITHSSIRTLI